MIEVLFRFLALGCVSFGGPVAHIAYFRTMFVERLKWLDEHEFTTRLSLCNVLPGPTSSQLGFAIGHHRAGLGGAIAAFIGFTLPSFLLMFGLATLVFYPEFSHQAGGTDNGITHAVVAALKLAALVIVVDALLTMLATFCRTRFLQCLAAIAFVVFISPFLNINPILPMLLGGVAHYLSQIRTLDPAKLQQLTESENGLSAQFSVRINLSAVVSLFLFCVLLISSWALLRDAEGGGIGSLFASFYQVGASTFGGGHVVLPLLFERLDTLVTQDALLTAYAAAQAVPGPMFTIATFLGADLAQTSASVAVMSIVSTAMVTTLAIFLPGFLLLTTLLPVWSRLSAIPEIGLLIGGINAVVVGLLAAALFQFVAPSALASWLDLAVTAALFVLLRFLRMPVLLLLLLCTTYQIAWLYY